MDLVKELNEIPDFSIPVSKIDGELGSSSTSSFRQSLSVLFEQSTRIGTSGSGTPFPPSPDYQEGYTEIACDAAGQLTGIEFNPFGFAVNPQFRIDAVPYFPDDDGESYVFVGLYPSGVEDFASMDDAAWNSRKHVGFLLHKLSSSLNVEVHATYGNGTSGARVLLTTIDLNEQGLSGANFSAVASEKKVSFMFKVIDENTEAVMSFPLSMSWTEPNNFPDTNVLVGLQCVTEDGNFPSVRCYGASISSN
jgi:hypothetical protein